MQITHKSSLKIEIDTFEKLYKEKNRRSIATIFKKLVESIEADNIYPEEMNKHDKLFIPRTRYEKEFWEKHRKIAKKDREDILCKIRNGKLGGRPKKTIDNKNK